MTFRTLDALGDVAGKRALVRVDFNVPMKDGAVTDNTRLRASVPTVTELADRGAAVRYRRYGRPRSAMNRPGVFRRLRLVRTRSCYGWGSVRGALNSRRVRRRLGGRPGRRCLARLADAGQLGPLQHQRIERHYEGAAGH